MSTKLQTSLGFRKSQIAQVSLRKYCHIQLLHICDLLSQNEHKVATGAIQDYYRLKFSIMQATLGSFCGSRSLV